MGKVPVAPNRAQIDDDGISIRVTMRAPRSPAAMGFLMLWMCGWALGERFAVRQLLHGGLKASELFLMVWLAAWTVAGVFCVFTIVWMAAGREVVTLRADALVIRRALFGVGREREYDLASVKALRVGPVAATFARALSNSNRRGTLEAYGLGGGPLVFDYGPRTIKCGAALDEAEATAIVERLWQRNPRLRPRETA